MRSFRVLVILLCLILLLPAIPLVTHGSASSAYGTGLVLGRYAPEYFAPLVLYGLVLVGLVVLAIRPSQRLQDLILRPVRWLQARPLILGILLYGFVEIWFQVKHLVVQTRFFDDLDLILIVVSVALLELYLAGVLLVAGREPVQRRNVLINTSLFMVSTAVLFVMFAFGYALIIRQEDYVRRHQIWTTFHRPDSALAYSIRPDQQDFLFNLIEEDTYVPVSTDKYGFRNDVDIAHAPLAGLGDSMVFGLYVRNDELWSAVLSEELGVPVANYGVMGYSIWQYNLVADRHFREMDHQVVFYGIFGNDLRGEKPESKYDIAEVRWIQMGRWRSPINFTVYNLLDESPIYQIREALQKASGRSARETTAETVELPYGLDSYCVPWAIGYRRRAIPSRLDEAIELSEEIGYQLVFVLIPSKESVYAEELAPACSQQALKALRREREGYQQICEYVESQGLLCYDMTEDMRAAADEEGLLNFRVDGHWNPEGHQVFARLLADYIREHDLLAE